MKWGSLSNTEQSEYRALLNTIGNLTLLEASLNQSAGNNTFAGKAAQYVQSQVPATRALASQDRWDIRAIKERTGVLAAQFLQVWPRRSDLPVSDEDELSRLIDLPRPDLRGYPDVFEFAEFNGELWDPVHTSKQLLVRLVDELCKIDEVKLAASEYGYFVVTEREPGKSYEKLANGKFLYTGWWHAYLLKVAQALIEEFDLADALRVKLAPELDEVPLGT